MAFGASWYLYASKEAATRAVRLYGHNVDAGAIEGITAICYFIPNAVLFASASLSVWRRWPIRWVVQAVAAVGLLGPILWVA
jgi:hypothetical protein